jgi:hypothetical protein
MKDVFDRCPDWDKRDARLTTLGRHFRLHPGLKAIVGRDEEENARLEEMAGRLPVASLARDPGPASVLRGEFGERDRVTVGRLLRHFAPKVTGRGVEVCVRHEGRVTAWQASEAATADDVKAWAI